MNKSKKEAYEKWAKENSKPSKPKRQKLDHEICSECLDIYLIKSKFAPYCSEDCQISGEEKEKNIEKINKEFTNNLKPFTRHKDN